MIERELGLFDQNGDPKPVAYVMRDMSKLLDVLPDPFPKRKSDGVCVLSRAQAQQKVAIASLILGKQAGIDLDVVYTENGDIPESQLYFMPVISGWQVIYKKTWETLLERVRAGAVLYVSYGGGQMTEFPETVGAESMGVMAGTSHKLELGNINTEYHGKEILLSPTSAEVLLKNEAGNPVLLKNKVGRGEVYFVNFAPESIVFDTPDGFNRYPYHLIYKTVAERVISKKPVKTDDTDLAVTINPEEEGTCLVSILNYGDKDAFPDISIAPSYNVVQVLYGSLDVIPACNGVIFRIKK
jgi:hypothetical protein